MFAGGRVVKDVLTIIPPTAALCHSGEGRRFSFCWGVSDRSLVVGVPGRVRPLTLEQEQRLQDPTAIYVENARRFRAAGLSLTLPENGGQDFRPKFGN